MIYLTKPVDFSPRFEVVLCHFECDGKILLLHRRDDKSQGGRWGRPGGKREAGEELVSAMVRELREELSYDVDPAQLRFQRTFYVRYPTHDFLTHVFHLSLVAPPNIQITPLEHQAFVWKSVDEALRLPLVLDEDECVRLTVQQLTK